MKGRPTNDRDEFEHLVRRARMERAVYLGEALAGAAQAVLKRIGSVLGAGPETRRPAAR